MNGHGPIGLFGGSFNPPHRGHRALVLHAKKRLGLLRVRVLVSPQNPLKAESDYRPFSERFAATERMMAGLKSVSVEAEAQTGPVYAIETLTRMISQARGQRLVYLLGADSFTGLHRWKDWQAILEAIPVAVINRPGERHAALNSLVGRHFAWARVQERDAKTLAFRSAPAWCFLNGLNQNISSSEIRRNQNPL